MEIIPQIRPPGDSRARTLAPAPADRGQGRLFPVMPEAWRSETQHLSKTFTRKGNHYWRYVPAGTYLVGGWGFGEEGDSKAAPIPLQAFWIARYPLTVQQYHQFLQQGGYADRAYWTSNGWKWKKGKARTQPHWLHDERFNSHSQPLVWVTWYEVAAFAAWLTANLQNMLTQGSRVRLPTEAEWEVAAAYDEWGQRHTYPWGEQEPTRTLADFDDGSEPKAEGPAPVGERPAGSAACGAQDMVGSVWEMTCSRYAGYTTESSRVVRDFSTGEWDVPWRGGCWMDDRTHIRCAARGWALSDTAIDYEGARLVLGPG